MASGPHRPPSTHRLAAKLADLAQAAVDYDEAILACCGDPARLTKYRTVQGDDLDVLYFRLMSRARTVLGLPNVFDEFEPQPWGYQPPKEGEVS